MNNVDLIVAALRHKLEQDHDLLGYVDAGAPLGQEGALLWLEYETGTTVN